MVWSVKFLLKITSQVSNFRWIWNGKAAWPRLDHSFESKFNARLHRIAKSEHKLKYCNYFPKETSLQGYFTWNLNKIDKVYSCSGRSVSFFFFSTSQFVNAKVFFAVEFFSVKEKSYTQKEGERVRERAFFMIKFQEPNVRSVVK